MNLLRINKEIHPVYWVDDFLLDVEIDKIIEYSKQINAEPSKVGGNIQEETKKFNVFFIMWILKDLTKILNLIRDL